MKYDPECWTYGAELEFGDLDRRKPTVESCGWDVRDFTMMNENGVAVDPKGVVYPYGGEINTAPTTTIYAQVKLFKKILRHYPEATINHRSNLHVHIRLPGLREDLETLKKLQKYIHEELPKVIDIIEPIPKPEGNTKEEMRGAMRRYRRRKVSHHTFLTASRLAHQLSAPTIDEFFIREVPKTKASGAPMWHAQPRVCVNIRQLKETDTIEFRHFPLTLDPLEFESALLWCKLFLKYALSGRSCSGILFNYGFKFPKFPPYVHWMEERYRLTCHDGSVPKDQILKNIERFLNEDSSAVPGKRKP